MSNPVYTIVQSGQNVSAPVTLERSDKPLAVFISSLSPATEVRLQFGVSSGGQFADTFRLDGSGQICVIASTAGPCWALAERVLTPWARLSLVQAQTDLRSFTLVSLND